MNRSQENSRECLRRAVDAEIQSLEEPIQALRRRRNALAPISSLPPEVIAAIFSFVRLLGRSILPKEPCHPACIRVSHVCQQWREIALNQPLLWSHVNFATLTSAGAAEFLARTKRAPLFLDVKVPNVPIRVDFWGEPQFSAFQNEFWAHVSHARHLNVSAHSCLRKVLEGFVSPAPILEYLSLSSEEDRHKTIRPRVIVPDNIFDGSTPRLSCLVLKYCDISWKSSLLKGLRHLEICEASAGRRPSLSVWLDVLDEMPQIRMLTLHSATPVVPHGASLPSEIERTVTLPSLTYFNISSSAHDCGLALAHLVLPALTSLCVMAKSTRGDQGDVREILPYVSQHAHGPQDAQPLQSMVVNRYGARIHTLAWPEPDADIALSSPTSLFAATRSSRVSFIVTNKDSSPGIGEGVFDAAVAALSLDSLVTLTAGNSTRLLDKEVWLHHAPRWPLLQRVRLAPPAACGFREMLLEGSGGRESPLLPSLTELVLVKSALSARRTLRTCDALMKRVEQGVPLETLDLSTCHATDRSVQLFSEIVVDVLGPGEAFRMRARVSSSWDSAAGGFFVDDDDFEAEDSDEDDEDEDEEMDLGIGNDMAGEVDDNWGMEEDWFGYGL